MMSNKFKVRYNVVVACVIVIVNVVTFLCLPSRLFINNSPRFEVEDTLLTTENYEEFSGVVTDIVNVTFSYSHDGLDSEKDRSPTVVEGDHMSSITIGDWDKCAFVKVENDSGEHWFFLNSHTIIRQRQLGKRQTIIALGNEVNFGYYASGRYASSIENHDQVYIIVSNTGNNYDSKAVRDYILYTVILLLIINAVMVLAFLSLYRVMNKHVGKKSIKSVVVIVLNCIGASIVIIITFAYFLLSVSTSAVLSGNEPLIQHLVYSYRIWDYSSYLRANLPDDTDICISNIFIGSKFKNHSRQIRICITSGDWIDLYQANEVLRLTEDYINDNPNSLIGDSCCQIEVSNYGWRELELDTQGSFRSIYISMIPDQITIEDVYEDIDKAYIQTEAGLTDDQYDALRNMFPNAVFIIDGHEE